MKDYWFDTEKGFVIRALIRKGDWWFEDYEIETFLKKHFTINFNVSDVGARLSDLKRDWILMCEYFENPKQHPIPRLICWKRAKYKLTEEAKEYYKTLYNEKETKTLLSYFK